MADIENHTLRLLQEIRKQGDALSEKFDRLSEKFDRLTDGFERHRKGVDERLKNVQQAMYGEAYSAAIQSPKWRSGLTHSGLGLRT